ncbi:MULTISPECIES: transposase [unclassified Wenzhouxiangella]|uniref:transposase n=1 Tax=unclassified Wenzhouxiangella TaxID=2613841 RepID=UPI000E3273F7|nr:MULTISPECIES: transposase [unclassified Wenzhouxiangella]RFF27647.1 hypothetical protein DZK25_06400 [Wenzhouxiangella sp. 15181]RFP69740.1 hypothetical protein DZK26_02295 [Wenzhouxiangella sp. 15190]
MVRHVEKRKFSNKFKQEAVRLTEEAGVSCTQDACELQIGPSLLAQCRREQAKDGE